MTYFRVTVAVLSINQLIHTFLKKLYRLKYFNLLTFLSTITLENSYNHIKKNQITSVPLMLLNCNLYYTVKRNSQNSLICVHTCFHLTMGVKKKFWLALQCYDRINADYVFETRPVIQSIIRTLPDCERYR